MDNFPQRSKKWSIVPWKLCHQILSFWVLWPIRGEYPRVSLPIRQLVVTADPSLDTPDARPPLAELYIRQVTLHTGLLRLSILLFLSIRSQILPPLTNQKQRMWWPGLQGPVPPSLHSRLHDEQGFIELKKHLWIVFFNLVADVIEFQDF